MSDSKLNQATNLNTNIFKDGKKFEELFNGSKYTSLNFTEYLNDSMLSDEEFRQILASPFDNRFDSTDFKKLYEYPVSNFVLKKHIINHDEFQCIL